MFGDGGDDNVLGASGDDELTGGTGSDRLSGGDGVDTAFDYGELLHANIEISP